MGPAMKVVVLLLCVVFFTCAAEAISEQQKNIIFMKKCRRLEKRNIGMPQKCVELLEGFRQDGLPDKISVQTSQKSPKAPTQIPILCGVCQQVVNFLLPIVNLTEETVNTAVGTFCSVLPSPLTDLCSSLTQQFFGIVWGFINYELDNARLCSQLLICDSITTTNPVLQAQSSQQPLKAPTHNPVLCGICQQVVGFLQPIVNTIQGVVDTAVGTFCSLLPPPFSGICSNTTQQFLGLVFGFINTELDNATICYQILLCDSIAAANPVLQAQSFRKTIKAPTRNPVLCGICQQVVGFLQPIVNIIQGVVDTAVGTFCSLLPPPFSQICSNTTQQFLGLVFGFINTELDNSTICYQLFLCDSIAAANPVLQAQSFRKTIKAPTRNPVLCGICQQVVGFLQPIVNTIQGFVDTAVGTLCSFLPPPFSQICSNTTQQVLGLVFGFINTELDNATICYQLFICDSIATANPVLKAQSSRQPLKAPTQIPILCGICQQVVGFLQPIVATIQGVVDTAVGTVCSFLPPPLSGQCSNITQQFLGLVWGFVNTELENATICYQLFICDSIATANPVLKAQSSRQPLKAPIQIPILCGICQQVVGFLQPIVATIQGVVDTAVGTVCSFLPPPLSGQCSNITQQFLGLVWGFVNTELENATICYQLFICDSIATANPVLKAQSSRQPLKAPTQIPILCGICQQVVGFLQPIVATIQGVVDTAVGTVCSFLPPPLSGQCSNITQQFLGLVWGFVNTELDNATICYQLFICDSIATANPVLKAQSFRKTIKAPTRNPILCGICQQVVGFLQPIVNTIQGVVDTAVGTFCSLLPPPFSGICSNTTQQFLGLVFGFINTELDNSTICYQLFLCDSIAAANPVLQLHVALQGLRHSKAALLTDTHKVQKPAAIPVLCQICQLVLNFVIRPIVDSNATEATILGLLERLCSLLPDPFSTQCSTTVPLVFPLAWGFLRNFVDSGQLCQALPICDFAPTVLPASTQDKQCALCNKMNSLLKPYVKSNSAEEVKTLIPKLCSILPSDIQDVCNSLSSTYFNIGWQIFKVLVDGGTLCQKVGVCSSTKPRMRMAATPPVAKAAPKAAPKAGIVCTICGHVMEKMESLLVNNATKAKIETTLEKVCGYLPATLQTECPSFVEKYSPQIIQLIDNGISPRVVCQKLGLCSNNKKMSSKKQPGL